ncbi:serine/threonine-protein kinase Nek4-like [Physella acuta]|uniref:serine/threonine-protein kinase Nek4-like n=1 Tax=Physella acuta TaxID=109671 RepID=UPI0027DCDC5E|nr:serine/threonine-protein kinase Nek4-like [Physella acuta]XP_059150607.1 serine/threonine-protein kinase Nek4-like [Physella acuta]XP_059150609.1 serine/threonine-protein kinase Nek4-like [Physella acuta]
MERYTIVKRLGVGAHGAVYLVKHTETNRLLAMKKIEVDERKKTRTKEAVLKEASILSQLRHPHIILFHESFLDPTLDNVCIILDYCDGGNMSELIQQAAQTCRVFTERQIMQWFIQIVMAVQYIHSKHILHRDLKAENVFLNKRNMIKLGDFGISKILENTIDVAKTVVGTPSYLSPELCQDIPYNSKSDIWAVGCLLYEMCVLHPPFDGKSLISLFINIIKAGYKPFPSDAPTGIQELVRQILQKNPEDRPSASAILNMPYVKQHLTFFIADTESIRTCRPRRDITSAGDFSPAHSSLFVEASSHPSSPWVKAPDVQYTTQDLTVTDAGSDYSDDFDESTSEAGEEISASPGDGGDTNCEEELLYADDFEQTDSEEDVDEVLSQALAAQVVEAADDDFADDEFSLTLTHHFRSYMEEARVQTDG